MSDRPRLKIDLAQFYGAAEPDPLVCPGCGARRFIVVNTFWIRAENGRRTKRRLRKCSLCEYAQNETVPPPIVDNPTADRRGET